MPTYIDAIRQLSAYEIISRYQGLKHKGSSYVGICPFHNDTTPSLSVKVSAQRTFKCFVCGEGGSGIDYVMKREKQGFVDACRTIAQQFGIPIKEKAPMDIIYKAYEDACVYMENLLVGSAKKYASSRVAGLSTWRIGYCDNNLHNHLTSLGYDPLKLLDWGISAEKNGRIFSPLNNRIVFPIFDAFGRVINFSGRSMDEDAKPKYINGKNNPIYNKSKVLYGLHLAKEHIKTHNMAIVVEGYTDVTTLQVIDVKNTIGKCGTELTPKQITDIKSYCDRVMLVSDGDNAGENSLKKNIVSVLSSGLKCFLLRLPNSGVKTDPDKFFTSRTSFVDYYKVNGVEVFANIVSDRGDKLFDVW